MVIDRTGGPYRLGVIGDPVAHSLSPSLHQPALDLLGIPAVYERWHTSAAELPSRIGSLRKPDVLGASVTVPHKIAVMRLVDDVSPAAIRAGAVNTVINRDGALFGDNTDIYGFGTSVSEALGGAIPRRALVLGAGGAARAVVLALESLAIGEIVVANRDVERAERMARDLSPAPARVVPLEAGNLRQELARAHLLVNATSLGWHTGEAPLDLELLRFLPGGALVADLTYRDTDLLRAAIDRNLRVLDGLGMLVHQGARAFTLWTGQAAPLETMLASAQRARAAS
ncbi:MAG: shikimate dehydrogenase [Thermomicrobiales bacterium]